MVKGHTQKLCAEREGLGTRLRQTKEEHGGVRIANLHWFAHAHVELETMYAATEKSPFRTTKFIALSNNGDT